MGSSSQLSPKGGIKPLIECNAVHFVPNTSKREIVLKGYLDQLNLDTSNQFLFLTAAWGSAHKGQ